MRDVNTFLLGAVMASAVALPAVAQDKSVTIVLSEELDIVEPCMSSRSNVGRVILHNISETLTELGVRGEGLVPRLATGWEPVDEDTWRFTLRPDVTFTDGSTLDAADVVHSIERTNSDKIVCDNAAKYFGGIDVTTEILDPLTLEITTSPPQPILPLLLSGVTIVPSDTDPNAFVREPIGTGPYVFSEWNIGQNIVLDRNPDYWGDAPEVERATYVFRPDAAVAAAMVTTGEADIVPSISVQDATNAATDFSYPNSETFFLRIDTETAPLNDRRVREALNLSIDREAYQGTILAAGVIPATQIVPPSTVGWNGDLAVWPYDLDRARKLLDEAREDGVPVDTEIKLIGRSNNFPNATEVMEAMLAMIQDAGFTASLRMHEVSEWEDFYSKPFAADRAPQLVAAQHDNAKGDPVFTMFFKYHSDGLQGAVWSDALDATIDKATAATGDERAALWKEAFRMTGEEIITDIPMFHMVGFARVSERLNFTPTIATNSELQLSQISFN